MAHSQFVSYELVTLLAKIIRLISEFHLRKRNSASSARFSTETGRYQSVVALRPAAGLRLERVNPRLR